MAKKPVIATFLLTGGAWHPYIAPSNKENSP